MTKLSTTNNDKKVEVITVRLPKGWRSEISRIAFEQDRSQSALVKRALDFYLQKEHNINLKKLSK
jgi:predicted transcriptional regulator